MQDQLEKQDEGVKFGGSRRPQARVTLLTDTVGTCAGNKDFPSIICAIGDVTEGPARFKVMCFFTEDCLWPRDDGKLHLQDASHILELDEHINERFQSVAVHICPHADIATYSTEFDDKNSDIDASSSIQIIVIASCESHLIRWQLRLDRDIIQQDALYEKYKIASKKRTADISRRLQLERPWRSIPAPQICAAAEDGTEGFVYNSFSTTVILPISTPIMTCRLSDCNSQDDIDEDTGLWTSMLETPNYLLSHKLMRHL